MNNILLWVTWVAWIIPISCADTPPSIGCHSLYASDMAQYSGSSHSLSMAPLELDNTVSHNWKIGLALGSTLVPEHAHVYAERPELFKKADTLFFAGDLQKLQELGKSYSSLGSYFTFSARENRMVARHIDSLLQNRLLPKFVALKQGQALQVPQILEEVFAATHDSMVRTEAIILADDIRSGTIGEYSPMLFESIHDKTTEMMVTTRFGTHAIDKLLPERGTSLNLGEAHDFGRMLMPTIDKFPESVRESLIRYGVEGFIERSMDPGTTMSQYACVVSELATGIYDELLGYYLKGPEYEQLRKQEIAQFGADLDKKLSSYTSKDYARLTGAAISDACALRAVIAIGCFAYRHIVAPIVCPRARMTVENFLSECTVKEVTPHQGNHAGVRELRCPKSYEEFIKDLKEMSVIPLKEYSTKKGLVTVGKEVGGKKLIVRPFCSNPKLPKDTPTFEIQPINKLIEKTIKARSEV